METDCGKLIQKAQINNRSKVLGLSEQALKGQEKRKAEADGNGEKPAEGWGDRSAWTNLPRRNLRLPRHEQDPTYMGREERMKYGTEWGTSWLKN